MAGGTTPGNAIPTPLAFALSGPYPPPGRSGFSHHRPKRSNDALPYLLLYRFSKEE